MAKKKAGTRKKLPIELLADKLNRAWRESARQTAVARMKALIAETIWNNGASVESVAEKLGWNPGRILDLLESAVDVDLRTLADIFAVMGREIRFSDKEPA